MTPKAASGFDPAALRAARESARLSVEQLAQRLGMSRTSLSRWENGSRSPQVSTVAAIAAGLNLPVSRLMSPPSTLAGLRASAGLSQVEAGQAMGVSQPRYALIETGKARPSREQAVALAAAFGVDVETLEGVLTQE